MLFRREKHRTGRRKKILGEGNYLVVGRDIFFCRRRITKKEKEVNVWRRKTYFWQRKGKKRRKRRKIKEKKENVFLQRRRSTKNRRRKVFREGKIVAGGRTEIETSIRGPCRQTFKGKKHNTACGFGN